MNVSYVLDSTRHIAVGEPLIVNVEIIRELLCGSHKLGKTNLGLLCYVDSI